MCLPKLSHEIHATLFKSKYGRSIVGRRTVRNKVHLQVRDQTSFCKNILSKPEQATVLINDILRVAAGEEISDRRQLLRKIAMKTFF